MLPEMIKGAGVHTTFPAFINWMIVPGVVIDIEPECLMILGAAPNVYPLFLANKEMPLPESEARLTITSTSDMTAKS